MASLDMEETLMPSYIRPSATKIQRGNHEITYHHDDSCDTIRGGAGYGCRRNVDRLDCR